MLLHVLAEVFIFGFFVEGLQMSCRNNRIELLGIRIRRANCFYHLGEDHLAKFYLCHVGQLKHFEHLHKRIGSLISRWCFLAQNEGDNRDKTHFNDQVDLTSPNEPAYPDRLIVLSIQLV